PADAVPGLRAEHLADASLHGVLTRQFGLRPGAGRNQIRAVAADSELAALLDTQAGTPLLMLQGQGMDQHGKPLEWFTTWHRAEQLVFDVDVSMGHESVQPRLHETAPEPQAAVNGQDPLAQALVAELSAELARLRGQC
uniref:UTRA domain-containing protein n=1 Tax=Achromobacter animicus TaxID=1389935 RepID=UPI0028AEA261